MPYLTQQYFDSINDLPISLPIADLYPEEWIIISSHRISTPQTLTLRWLQAYILSSTDPDVISSTDGSVILTPNSAGEVVLPSQTPELVTSGLGLAFLGLYKDFDSLNPPAFQAAQEAPLVIGDTSSVPPVPAIRSLDPLILSTEGAYSFVLCNNTTNRLLRVVVNGQIRGSLGFNPAT